MTSVRFGGIIALLSSGQTAWLQRGLTQSDQFTHILEIGKISSYEIDKEAYKVCCGTSPPPSVRMVGTSLATALVIGGLSASYRVQARRSQLRIFYRR